jgi:deoxyribonuclease (pyrimidine dimer)
MVKLDSNTSYLDFSLNLNSQMTRINTGITPRLLTNKHLLAEHREIKRIPNAVANGKVNMNDIPSKFCLGKGHIKYFCIRLEYLLSRYKSIYSECIVRGFNVQDYSGAWQHIPQDHPNVSVSFVEVYNASAQVAQRINIRLGLNANEGIQNWHELIDGKELF